MLKYFDAHSHIHGKEYDADREEVISRMKDKGVGTFAIGTHLESSKEAVKIAEKYENIWATIGLHPTDTKDSFKPEEYGELVQNPKVVGIGECGFDYFRFKGDEALEKARQREDFEKQLEFAVRFDKPLMIHCRPSGKTMDAHEDMIALLSQKKEKYAGTLRGNIHFFTGTLPIAKRYFDLGFSVSFSGVITFAPEYDVLVRECDLDHILSETDAPYASPLPFRGKRNEPVFVIETVTHIARLKGESEEVVSANILQNIERIFKISL